MNFIGSESRARAKFIEGVLTETDRCLDFRSMQNAKGEAGIEWMRDRIKQMYVPNVKHETISVPKGQTDGIALLPIQEGQHLRLGFGFNDMSRLQRHRAATVLKSLNISSRIIPQIDTAFSTASCAIPIKLNNRASGLTTGNVVRIFDPENTKFGKDKSRLIFGRPLLALIIRESDTDEQFVRRGATLAHELNHWRQREMHPIQPGDIKKLTDVWLEDELYAYYNGAVYEAGLFNSDDPLYARNDAVFNDIYIETLRRKNEVNPKEPFKPSGTIEKALNDLELDTIYNIIDA